MIDVPEESFFRALRKLTGHDGAAEYELDLTGLDLAQAGASIQRMLERSRFRAPRTVAVRLDPPAAGGGETLFGPVGRMLMEAMRAGRVTRCRPLPEPGAGFWISLAGNAKARADEPGETGKD